MNSLFRVSERHHSGLILMTELASAYSDPTSFLSLSEIADRMHISSGYLEEIALRLREADLIEGRKGPGGGYRLKRAPNEITAEEIICAVEGPLALVDCHSNGCPVEGACQSKALWNFLYASLRKTLQDTTLSSIIKNTL